MCFVIATLKYYNKGTRFKVKHTDVEEDTRALSMLLTPALPLCLKALAFLLSPLNPTCVFYSHNYIHRCEGKLYRSQQHLGLASQQIVGHKTEGLAAQWIPSLTASQTFS